MKKILLLSAVLLGAVSVSQAGIQLHLGLPLPPLPPLPHVVIGTPHVTVEAPAPVYAPPVCPAPAYSYAPDYCPPAVVVEPPVVSFGFGYPYYGHYGHYYRGGGYYHGGYYRGGYYHGGYRHHGRWETLVKLLRTRAEAISFGLLFRRVSPSKIARRGGTSGSARYLFR